jgi:hypothetical protein
MELFAVADDGWVRSLGLRSVKVWVVQLGAPYDEWQSGG